MLIFQDSEDRHSTTHFNIVPFCLRNNNYFIIMPACSECYKHAMFVTVYQSSNLIGVTVTITSDVTDLYKL